MTGSTGVAASSLARGSRVPGCDVVADGRACLGVELGSTRIKACLIDPSDAAVLAAGSFEWASRLDGGYWTYGLDEIRIGLQAAYARLATDCEARYGLRPNEFGAIGVSAMMHGYLAFGADDELLVPFRTWRNMTTAVAAKELSDALGINVPQRWSAAHLYQAVLDGEEHVSRLAWITTLAGYVHYRLTGTNVLGVGDASGMFPIDAGGSDYDGRRLSMFADLLARHGLRMNLHTALPRVLQAGEDAGALTEAGVRFLDPSGRLRPGAPLCPPEGDAGTGMVATGALAPRVGNVSVGTSTFAMVVLERPLATARPEIDVVATPSGDPVAMVHCNNGASGVASWVDLFVEWAAVAGAPIDASVAYAALFNSALAGPADAGGVVAYHFVAGEPVVDIADGSPLLVRQSSGDLSFGAFARAQIYGVFAALTIGMRLLTDDGVRLDRMLAHGGMFATPGAAQRLLAAALGAPVTVAETAAEGGAWGIAVLAAYRASGAAVPLDTYVATTAFAGVTSTTIQPEPADVAGYARFLTRYRAGLPLARQGALLV